MAIENAADLYNHIKAYFDEWHVHSPVYFGWKKPAEQNHKGGKRVVVVPGDDSGKAERINLQPVTSSLGSNVFLTNGELITIYVWARDQRPDFQTNEEANYVAVSWLRDWVYRACQDAAPGRIRFDQPIWILEPKQVVAGKELKMLVELRRGIPEAPITGEANAVGHSTGYLNESVGCCDDCED